ncbi:MAG: ABC transporter ATP-binding protein, partial [Candidatus Sericytochromatia bacterium]
VNLKKSFGKLNVLKGINLSLKKGHVIAVMGPNGSGKTTFLKSLVGLVIPDSGEVLINGNSIKNNWKYRDFIGYMPQIARYPENLKVKELIEMIKDIRGSKSELDEELIDLLKISNINEKTMVTLSGGNKQRVSAVLAFLFNQDIVILDEPTAGLDPVSSEHVKSKILKEKEKGKLIIVTSHIMSEVEEIADRIIYILEGNIHIDNTVEEIKLKTNESRLSKAIATIIGNYV